MLVICCFEALNIKILAKMCVICWKLIFYLSITDPRLIIKQMIIERSIIDVFIIKCHFIELYYYRIPKKTTYYQSLKVLLPKSPNRIKVFREI